MKRRFVWILIGSCLLGGMLGAAASWANYTLKNPSSKQPHALVHCYSRDFGVIKEGELLHARFPISNTGNKRLIVVKKVDPCCDSSATNTTIVPPGETRILTTTVNTGFQSGQIVDRQQYSTNDPQLPQFILSVRACVGSDS